MEREEIAQKLAPVFKKVFGDASLEITDELTARDVENWDSLSHMLLITEVENEFGIKFKLKELNKMVNVGAMIAIINSKL
jgi:acyl carrier protein